MGRLHRARQRARHRQVFCDLRNALGGCQGTTGPSSICPETGEPWGPDFPVIQIPDIVDVHAELVRSLGIDRLLAVVGGSLGGMQVLEWAARYPDRLASAVVLASCPRMSAQGIAFNAVGRSAIFNDPNFNNGRYYRDSGPRAGLALARMVAHITYLSEESIERKFGRKLQDVEALAYDLIKETEFQVESYLNYQGRRFVDRFDANSYLYLTKAMDYYDLAQSYGSIENAFAASRARFLVISYDSDWLYPTRQSKEVVGADLGRQARLIHRIASRQGARHLFDRDRTTRGAGPPVPRTDARRAAPARGVLGIQPHPEPHSAAIIHDERHVANLRTRQPHCERDAAQEAASGTSRLLHARSSGGAHRQGDHEARPRRQPCARPRLR